MSERRNTWPFPSTPSRRRPGRAPPFPRTGDATRVHRRRLPPPE